MITKQGALRIGALVAIVALAAGCGGDDDDGGSGTSAASASASTAAAAAAESGGEPVRIAYSAWPGWFPLAVAEEKGLFAEAGLDVELTFFADYTASLDALVAGAVDVNAQTLNDTIFGVASGAEQRVVVVNDNSTGNDAVICDASVASVADLRGKSIAAEAGVVDHFLLLQGLAANGLSEQDINFSGVKTDAAAAAFAGGEFDCVAVFAPFTLQALERPGSKVLFSSADFPGIIPDHLVTTAALVDERPEAVQQLVNAWYATLDWIEANPEEATAIMAARAEVTPEEYAEFAEGTTLFSAEDASEAFADRADDPTSLPEMARRINPFLVESGLTEQEADLTGLFEPSFTEAYVSEQGG